MALMTGTSGDFFRAILSSQAYKPGQGIKARHGTIAALGILILFGMYSWSRINATSGPILEWGVPAVGGVIFLWLAYRIVHFPRFADFLISTEAEMNKVSWSTRDEVKVSTIVVLITVVLVAGFMFVADRMWQWLLTVCGFLRIGGILGGGNPNMIVPFSWQDWIPSLPSLGDWASWFLF
ncbi:preprotein translocase subunit SecE [Planctomycetes bacterium Pan216]|uniref:Protein translocase subunit SecE n=1 Tax=Kolteria novifilia TaxID=2527975 RepID=A0A518BAR4_9BACT|nr:preprotein translocase subunit SecE [Planctomycetes bacterium Pan216]